jgi:hypothetical protein
MTSLEQYSNRPYVSFSERMQQNAARRQLMQDKAIARQYDQQKNALDLAQAQQKLQQDLQNYEQGYNGNTPSAIQEYNFLSKLSPREQALYLRAKAPNSQIQFENMGMMDGMGDVGGMNQPMTMPAPQRQPAAPSRRQPSMQQGPIVPTDGGDGLSEAAPTMPIQQTDTITPPVDLGNGKARYKGKIWDKKIAEKAWAMDYKNPTTEDERKGASWLLQANSAYKNLLKSMYNQKGERTGAERPNAVEAFLNSKYVPISPRAARRTAEREQFVQATETISDALLRAATGAGQNEAEARRKIEEITPSWFDDDATVKQKLDSIPAYIEAIKARAGRATPKGFTIPTVEGLGLNVGQQPTQNAAQPMMPAAGNVIQTIHGLVTVTK